MQFLATPIQRTKVGCGRFKGMAVFDDTRPWGEKLALYRRCSRLQWSCESLEKAEVEFLKVQQSEPLRNECQHFLDVVSRNV